MKLRPWKIIDTVLNIGESVTGPATPLGLVLRAIDAVVPGDTDVQVQAATEAAKTQTTEIKHTGDVSIKDTVKELAFGFVAAHPQEIQGFLDTVQSQGDNIVKKINLPGVDGEDEIHADDSLVGLFDAYWDGLVERRVMAAVEALKQ